MTIARIREHLENLANALVKEEEEDLNQIDGEGPCLEFLLQQNVIDRLCAMGMPDVIKIFKFQKKFKLE